MQRRDGGLKKKVKKCMKWRKERKAEQSSCRGSFKTLRAWCWMVSEINKKKKMGSVFCCLTFSDQWFKSIQHNSSQQMSFIFKVGNKCRPSTPSGFGSSEHIDLVITRANYWVVLLFCTTLHCSEASLRFSSFCYFSTHQLINNK